MKMIMKQPRWKTPGWCRREWPALWSSRTALIVAASLLLVAGFVLSRPDPYSEYLMRSLKGHIEFDDPELIEYIRNEIMVPPSTEPYNLLGNKNPALIAVENSEYFYGNMTLKLFKDVRNGLFVEAGALDGETMSNTLYLEKALGWSGLLVEADVVSYEKLKLKNRKAWIANVCLSPDTYPSKELMSSHSHYAGPNFMPAGTKMRAMHGLVQYRLGSSITSSWYKRVQCLPLESLLVARNLRHIDLLVLDVEGAEMDILSHFDFTEFQVDVLYLEWKHTGEHPDIAKKIEDRGFRLLSTKNEDLVFARKDSKYDPGVSYVIPPKNTTITKQQLETLEKLSKKGIALAF